jgi:hypothetical protein
MSSCLRDIVLHVFEIRKSLAIGTGLAVHDSQIILPLSTVRRRFGYGFLGEASHTSTTSCKVYPALKGRLEPEASKTPMMSKEHSKSQSRTQVCHDNEVCADGFPSDRGLTAPSANHRTWVSKAPHCETCLPRHGPWLQE